MTDKKDAGLTAKDLPKVKITLKDSLSEYLDGTMDADTFYKTVVGAINFIEKHKGKSN